MKITIFFRAILSFISFVSNIIDWWLLSVQIKQAFYEQFKTFYNHLKKDILESLFYIPTSKGKAGTFIRSLSLSICPSVRTIQLKILWKYQTKINIVYSLRAQIKSSFKRNQKILAFLQHFCCILYEIHRVIETYSKKWKIINIS